METCTIEIPEIPSGRKYWFLRTENGEYYKDFKENNFIAYGLDEISEIPELKAAQTAEDAYTIIYSKLLAIKKNKRSATFYTKQVLKFVNSFNIGDIVVIPSKRSVEYSIGIIESDIYIDPSFTNENPEALRGTYEPYTLCPYLKRRRVRWLKVVRRDKLPIQLLRFAFAHQALADVTKHDHYIDRLLHPVYSKNNKAYLSLIINQRNGIPAEEMANLLSAPITLLRLLNDSLPPEIANDNSIIESRVIAESPGTAQFVGTTSKIAGILLIIGVFSIGANLKINISGIELELQSKGIIQLYLEHVSEEHRHEEKMFELDLAAKKLNSSLNALEVNTPRELIK